MKGWQGWIVDQRKFYPESCLFTGGVVCWNRLKVGQSSGVWGKERNLIKVWLTSILLQLISGDKTVQLIMCEKENMNLEALAQGSNGGAQDSYLSRAEAWFFAVNHSLEHKVMNVFLNLHYFPGSQYLGKVRCCLLFQTSFLFVAVLPRHTPLKLALKSKRDISFFSNLENSSLGFQDAKCQYLCSVMIRSYDVKCCSTWVGRSGRCHNSSFILSRTTLPVQSTMLFFFMIIL